MPEITQTIFRIIFIGGIAVIGLIMIIIGIWLKPKERGEYTDSSIRFFGTWAIIAGSMILGMLLRELFSIPGLIVEAAFIGLVVAVILYVIGAKMYLKWPKTSGAIRTISAITLTVSLVFGV